MQKYKKAVALNYDQKSDRAPKIIARGAGGIARRIISIANEDAIPIVDDQQLLHLLYPLQPGEFIPESLYAPVAKILAYFISYKQKNSMKKGL